MSATMEGAARQFVVPAPGKAAWIVLPGIAVVLPAVIIVVVLLAKGGSFAEHGDTAAFALGLTALIAIPLALLMRRRQVLLQGSGQLAVLEVKAAMYTRRVRVAALDLAGARVVDLREQRQLRPVLKTNGYALPGFHAGHFRLRSGERGFCLVTDPSRVLVLPVPGEPMLLLSSDDPTALLDALRRAAG